MHHKDIDKILGIQGFFVKSFRKYKRCIIIHIERINKIFCCSECSQTSFIYHDFHNVKIRDLPISGKKVYLVFRKYRLRCSNCNIQIERLDFVKKNQRITNRYEQYLAKLCEKMPITSISELESIDKSTLYRIDKEYIKKRLSLREIPTLKSICIDEISYKKRHKYFTVISDQQRASVVWVSEGRAKNSLESFFKELGNEKCKEIKFVTMDMWKPYRLSIKERLPNAKIICDKFHLIRLLHIHVDKVRKKEQQDARLKNREIINNKKWILLKSEQNLNDKQLRSLKKLLSLNKNLAKCHILKEEFIRLFSLNSEHEAKNFILNWINKAYQTSLKSLICFANTLLKWFEFILNYFSNKITNSIAEGINNKIKTVKKIAYGYKDKDYFILKIYQYCGNLPKII